MLTMLTMTAMTVAKVTAIPVAAAHVVAPNPAPTMAISRNPYPAVSFVPVVGAMIIRPVTNTDREIDCFSFWREHRSSRSQHHRQQHYHFLFHTHFLIFRTPLPQRPLFLRLFRCFLFRRREPLCLFPARSAFPHIVSALAVSHKTQPPPSEDPVQLIFLKSTGPGLLMDKFDATIAIFIHPNKPRPREEVSRCA